MVKTAAPTLEIRYDLRPSPYLRFEMTSRSLSRRRMEPPPHKSCRHARPRACGGLMADLEHGSVCLTIGLHALSVEPPPLKSETPTLTLNKRNELRRRRRHVARYDALSVYCSSDGSDSGSSYSDNNNEAAHAAAGAFSDNAFLACHHRATRQCERLPQRQGGAQVRRERRFRQGFVAVAGLGRDASRRPPPQGRVHSLFNSVSDV